MVVNREASRNIARKASQMVDKRALLREARLQLSTQEMTFHTSQPKPKTTMTTSIKR